MTLPRRISGTVWKVGDHVNTDILHPPAYFSLDKERMKDGLREGMERLNTHLQGNNAKSGLVIVAGENFGCGSSRETSVRSLRICGVRAVIARSFARIFYRSLINLGIPPLECNVIQELVQNGDPLHLSLAHGFIELGGTRQFPFSPLDPHIERILECGGLIPYLRREQNGV
jgi:3-isopropylmalate/(R)-2-methylmalate dehydratase small subunit